MFFKYYFQHWRLCCICFDHRSLPLSQTWLLFQRGVLLLLICLPGLKSPQSRVLPLLSATEASKTTPLHVGTSYTHDIMFHSKGNVSDTQQIEWAGSLNHQIEWAVRGLRPPRTPINMATLPLQIRLNNHQCF